MPEPRPAGFPAKFLPRFRQSIRVCFGEKLDENELKRVLMAVGTPSPVPISYPTDTIIKRDSIPENVIERQRQWEAVTAVVHQTVENLGYSVSGPLLGLPHSPFLMAKPYTSR